MSAFPILMIFTLLSSDLTSALLITWRVYFEFMEMLTSIANFHPLTWHSFYICFIFKHILWYWKKIKVIIIINKCLNLGKIPVPPVSIQSLHLKRTYHLNLRGVWGVRHSPTFLICILNSIHELSFHFFLLCRKINPWRECIFIRKKLCNMVSGLSNVISLLVTLWWASIIVFFNTCYKGLFGLWRVSHSLEVCELKMI